MVLLDAFSTVQPAAEIDRILPDHLGTYHWLARPILVSFYNKIICMGWGCNLPRFAPRYCQSHRKNESETKNHCILALNLQVLSSFCGATRQISPCSSSWRGANAAAVHDRRPPLTSALTPHRTVRQSGSLARLVPSRHTPNAGAHYRRYVTRPTPTPDPKKWCWAIRQDCFIKRSRTSAPLFASYTVFPCPVFLRPPPCVFPE